MVLALPIHIHTTSQIICHLHIFRDRMFSFNGSGQNAVRVRRGATYTQRVSGNWISTQKPNQKPVTRWKAASKTTTGSTSIPFLYLIKLIPSPKKVSFDHFSVPQSGITICTQKAFHDIDKKNSLSFSFQTKFILDQGQQWPSSLFKRWENGIFTTKHCVS